MATTDSLLSDAKCIFECVPTGMHMPILISLFQGVAGVSLTTDQLIDGARCIDSCIPKGMQLPVLISLAQSILANGGGGGGGSSQVTNGVVDPVAAPANPAITNLYVNTVSGTTFVWPAGGSAWQ